MALLVDDSRAMRSVFRRCVEPLGFTVVEAENGLDALAQLSTMPTPDLILLDWNMPRMPGLQFVQELRRRYPDASTKVLMVSAENDPRRMRQVLVSGADAYLTKPFTPAMVAAEVAALGLGAA